MLESPAEFFSLLESYKYLIIFPLTIIEGPIIMIVSGFLVYLKVMDFWAALLVLVIADMLGDCGYHLIGRYWKSSNWVREYAGFLGMTEEREKLLENHFRKHKFKTFLFAKFAHGAGAIIQVASGIARVNFLHFVTFSFLSTIPKALILMTIGFYAGSSIAKIDNLLSSIALVTISILLVIVISYLILDKRIKRFLIADADQKK